MARQRFYANDSEIQGLDRLTGIDSVDNSTKNFTISDIAQFFARTGIADPASLSFNFTRTLDNSNPAIGQVSFGFTGGLNNSYTGLRTVTINTRDTGGTSLVPLERFWSRSDIKISNIDSATDTPYGIFQVEGNADTRVPGQITLTLAHVASDGIIGNDNFVISIVGAPLGSQRGNRVFDGTANPNGEPAVPATATTPAIPAVPAIAGINGDLYFQIIENPRTVNLFLFNESTWVNEGSLIGQTGPEGPTGPTGPTGPRGFSLSATATQNTGLGEDNTITITSTDPDASPVTVEVNAGNQGATGSQGPAGTTTAGTTTTGAAGTQANVENAGTPENRILNFTIPRGDTGAQGDSVDGVRTTTPGSATQDTGFTFNVNGTPIGNEIFVSPGPTGPAGAADLYYSEAQLSAADITNLNTARTNQGSLTIAITLRVPGTTDIATNRSYSDGQHVRIGDATNYLTGIVSGHDLPNGRIDLNVVYTDIIGNLTADTTYDVNLSGGTGGVGPRGASVATVRRISGGTAPGETTVIRFADSDGMDIPVDITIQPGQPGSTHATFNYGPVMFSRQMSTEAITIAGVRPVGDDADFTYSLGTPSGVPSGWTVVQVGTNFDETNRPTLTVTIPANQAVGSNTISVPVVSRPNGTSGDQDSTVQNVKFTFTITAIPTTEDYYTAFFATEPSGEQDLSTGYTLVEDNLPNRITDDVPAGMNYFVLATNVSLNPNRAFNSGTTIPDTLTTNINGYTAYVFPVFPGDHLVINIDR